MRRCIRRLSWGGVRWKTFRQFLPYCDEAFITKIEYDYDADKYLPNLDPDPDWVCAEVSEEQTYYDLVYERRRYVRKKK